MEEYIILNGECNSKLGRLEKSVHACCTFVKLAPNPNHGRRSGFRVSLVPFFLENFVNAFSIIAKLPGL